LWRELRNKKLIVLKKCTQHLIATSSLLSNLLYQHVFLWNGIDTLCILIFNLLLDFYLRILLKHIRVFAVDCVDQFTISRAVHGRMRLVPLFLPYNFSFAFSYNIISIVILCENKSAISILCEYDSRDIIAGKLN